MNRRIIGHVKRVNGPVMEVMGITDAEMFELVRVGQENLIGELDRFAAAYSDNPDSTLSDRRGDCGYCVIKVVHLIVHSS